MSIEQRWLRIVSSEERGAAAMVARPALRVLSGLYWLGLKTNIMLYQTGLLRHTRPAMPVISVGNLSSGGTGKSTAVRFVARELLAMGLRPGVVLRGHRREGREELLLASDGTGQLAPVAECGDEAAEVAHALPTVPVAVGKRRERVIELLADHGAQVALLDDGYQYFRMARDLNVALVSARMDLRAAHLLPRGVLREPWTHLKRADQVWITHADLASPEQLSSVRALLQRYAPKLPVVVTRHRPDRLVCLQTGQERPLSDLQGLKVLAVSGLGCPESFEEGLAGLGAKVEHLRFPDHHRYVEADCEQIARSAEAAGAEMVVTTDKDAVKLPALPAVDIWVLRSELEIIENSAAVRVALEHLRDKLNG
ncbi:MAG: tetraacyldisaccharide 4'-kinase [Armatimonadota bacterium]